MKIQEKLLNYLKAKNKKYLSLKIVTLSCGWAGGNTKSLKVEILDSPMKNSNFKEHKIDDIIVYVHDVITLTNQAELFQTLKLPFMPPVIGVKGVTNKDL